MSKKSERTRMATVTRHDPEAAQRHLKRQLDSLERDNHDSLNDVEGLINNVLAQQEDDSKAARKKRHKGTKANVYAAKTNLNVLLEDARLELLSPNTPSYLTCSAAPSQYPPRHFCSVCGFSSSYKCLRCGMKYCSVRCLGTHQETRFVNWKSITTFRFFDGSLTNKLY
ncbi:hypothetical protein BDB00DRAFT_252871 [Zychaea mexicana]|uniref:uncharacterized protein n=1 Tax=Zychaea mexicana TaxID=64656 RepID=UPI0022FDCF69|nr:uncharacterized protein BDB00DRAFT_252871 [Zychaea mexicana]KAI9470415.1 hypothetical protein BDB00DRAFT_252871 [Zychaea mexicana]